MEKQIISTEFAQKHVPIVYDKALERLVEPALAQLATERIFNKLLAAADSIVMPAEIVQEAWLAFLTEDVIGSMMEQKAVMSPTAHDIPPFTVPKTDTADAASPFTAPKTDTAYAESLFAAPKADTAYATSPFTAPKTDTAYAASPFAAPKADTAHAASPFTAPRRITPRKNVRRDTEVHFIPSKNPLRMLLVVLFGLLMLVNLWFIFGLMCSRGILPKVDLGYSWFDATITKLFYL